MFYTKSFYVVCMYRLYVSPASPVCVACITCMYRLHRLHVSPTCIACMYRLHVSPALRHHREHHFTVFNDILDSCGAYRLER